jgi:redox-sensitive bicupin YhaK (pirin superfamily)
MPATQSTPRTVARTFTGQETLDGAGVRLRRVFGFREVQQLDPFLLFDAFGSEDPNEYLAGFPWHPHRGIETVTYMLEGSVRHGDSLGNSGVIGPGDLQWMTAGGGIIHEEMPQRSPHGVRGFQLWVNLPASHKLTAPRYRDVLAADVPLARVPGAAVRVLCGRFGASEGPLSGIVRQPTYLDVTLEGGAALDLEAPVGETAFAYVFDGEATEPVARAGTCVLFGEGDGVRVAAGAAGARFVFVRGRPLREPIAWRGPIVMNTDEELEQAFREYRAGTFVK